MLNLHIISKKVLTYYYLCVIVLVPLKEGSFFVPAFLRQANKRSSLITEVPKMRVKVTLACTECKQRNYNTMKNKKNTPDRLEMNKYCRFCKKHTLHRETK